MANSPQKSSWMKARQTKYGAYAGLYTLVVLAVLVVGNWLASTHNKSIDVTANKQYSLSDQTKKILGDLKSDINVYYFDQTSNYDRARAMLDRYANLSSKLKVSYVDPEKKPDVARFEGARAMGDIVVDNGTKKETAKALTEEELTGAIVRVIKTGVRTVCFVKGSGENSIDDASREGYSILKTALERNNYKTQTISLFEKPEVPAECTVVVVAGPKHDYVAPAIDALKKYVTGGGHLVVNFDSVLDTPSEKLGDTPGLAAMVADWGVTAKADIVLDLSTASQMFSPTSPIAATYTSHPIVRVMQDTISVMPLSRGLDVKSPAEPLFSSSGDSYSLVNPKIPIKQSDVEKGPKGPFVLGAAATVGTGSKAGRVVIAGSSGWMANVMVGTSQLGNRNLALNVMNWLTSDEDLIAIRPKDPEDRRLHITVPGIRFLFSASVIGVPLIVILSGVAVWWKRR